MLHAFDIGLGRPLHHDHREPEPARRDQLANGGLAAGILGDEDLDALADHEIGLVIGMEGAALLDHRDLVQRQTVADRLDDAHEVAMPRRIGEGRQFKPADGEEDALRLAAKRGDCGLHVGNASPAVAFAWLPRMAADREQRHVLGLAGGLRVIGHDRREGMRGVDDGDDALLGKIATQAGDAAEPADADRQVQRTRVGGMTGERDDGANVGSLAGEVLVQRDCFARAAENEDGHAAVLA